MLPGGDSGFDLCRRICDMQEFSSALVIFLTARASEEVRIRGL
jgi:DNA-binding response OmpR family regulator